MDLLSISSGSSGNCICVGTDDCHLLVDAGISGKRIESGLNSFDLTCRDIKGILVTHEHMDHISGLGVLSRRHGIPIYATKGTIDAICQKKSLGSMDRSLFHVIQTDEPFAIDDLTIHPMHISHDAAEPVAFTFEEKRSSCSKKIGICTDLGVYDDYTIQHLEGMDALLLEANHDVHMLEAGSYPYALKMRILGEKGHLSNEASGQLLGHLLHDHIKHILLGHLSHENNMEDLASSTVALEVSMGDNPYMGSDFPIEVAHRDRPSEAIHI